VEREIRMLASELERLVAHLRGLNRPVIQFLQPGIDAGEVDAELGLHAPASVADWFRWCNGVAGFRGQIQDDVNVIPGYNPLSIEEAVRMMSSYAGDPVLGASWVPILGSASADIYAAVWSSDQEARVASVLVGEATEIEFSSIEQMVAVFNGCYEDGVFYIDDQGYLAMNSDLYDEVYARVTEP
jgi:hypothetical protein